MKIMFKVVMPILATVLVIASTPITVSAATAPTSRVATSIDGTGTATLAWNASVGATSYFARVLIGDVPIKTSPSLLPETRSYTFVGLEYGVPYKLQVKTNDSAWADGASTPASIIPKAAAPSAPTKPSVSVVADEKLKAEWISPTSTGGSNITKYLVQLIKGTESIGDPVVATGLSVELKTGDKTSSYSVTVAAVNDAALTSSPSEASTPLVAEKKAAATVVIGQPSAGGNTPSAGGNTPSAGGNTPSAGGNTPSAVGKTPSAGDNTPSIGGNTPSNASSPTIDQTKQILSPTPAIISYSRTVKVNSITSTKTILSLSKITVPSGSKVKYTISSSSKKYCQLKNTTLKNIKIGTCSIMVTVTSKTGKKSSRTVKLIAK